MTTNQPNDPVERRIHFVAKRYRKGILDPNAAWKHFSLAQGIRRTAFFRRYWVAAAVVLAALTGIGTLYVMEQSRPQWVVVITENKQLKDVYLPDSTMLSMAPGSWIRYDKKQYGKTKRSIEMRGKTFFRVQQNETCPFVVQTKATKVTVIGTRFLLTEQAHNTELYVESGKVSFAGGEQTPVILTAGMSAIYSDSEQKITVAEEERSNLLAWKTKKLVFHEASLEQVIRDLADCYGVRIAPKGKPASGLTLTASFDEMSLQEVLLIINQTLDTDLTSYPTNK